MLYVAVVGTITLIFDVIQEEKISDLAFVFFMIVTVLSLLFHGIFARDIFEEFVKILINIIILLAIVFFGNIYYAAKIDYFKDCLRKRKG